MSNPLFDPNAVAAVADGQCATKYCTNAGPLAIPVAAEGFYASVEDARRDARCRPCVEVIAAVLAPLTGDLELAAQLPVSYEHVEGIANELHELRFRVLQYAVWDLRGAPGTLID